ncbi:MAG: thiamine-phosphate kinase [Acidobacteria bacterium]|nr:thiamine-phosphate kinase [Acidobacteriota bacterium]
MSSEAELIERIAFLARRSSEDLILGIGDDAAIIRKDEVQWSLLSIDSQIENVHFRREYTPPRMLGHKALAVNLSDIAAMGGTPRFALLSLNVPKSIEPSYVEEVLAGMATLADQYSTILIGGDIAASGNGLAMTVTIIGECPAGRALRRDGARPGDLIFVTGRLGLAAFGLQLLQQGYRYAPDLPLPLQRPILAHLQPVPRLEVGQALAERQLANALIDISDGLSTDLFHICQASGVGAVVYAEKVPIAQEIPDGLSVTGLEMALNGGEDYELLFTVAKENVEQVESLRDQFSDPPITLIGEITNEAGRIYLEQARELTPLLPRGHDHLQQGKHEPAPK